jgi:transcription elongation factor/antiterminator RfaH
MTEEVLSESGTESKTGLRWYVVHTQVHAETRASVHLETQGYHVFCPRLRKTVRHARKSTDKLAPLFPGYLFLEMDSSRGRWRSVNGTRGVVRLLTQGDVPQPVPGDIIEALRSRADVHGIMQSVPGLGTGQRIRITEGPFEDLVGTLHGLEGADRVHVLLDLLGRSVMATLRYGALAPAA